MGKAFDYAEKLLAVEPKNITALGIAALAAQKLGFADKALTYSSQKENLRET